MHKIHDQYQPNTFSKSCDLCGKREGRTVYFRDPCCRHCRETKWTTRPGCGGR